jgi:hypothetical protein
MSVTISMSRWIPSGSIGRFENRDPDHALITTLVRGVTPFTRGERLGEHRPRLIDLFGEIRYGDQVDADPDDAHARNAS